MTQISFFMGRFWGSFGHGKDVYKRSRKELRLELIIIRGHERDSYT